MPPLLEVRDLRTGYGSLPVLHGISFDVEAGETAVMLGLNGAGKSTTLMAVAGLLKAWAGEVLLDGTPITKLETAARVQRGIVLIPEGRRVFPGLSVAVNLRLGSWVRRDDKKKQHDLTERVFEMFPRLAQRRAQLAGTLSGGEQQMLAIGRGLMSNPRVLLVDEASLGLAPKTAQELFETAKSVSQAGVAVLMVEQNAGALDVAQKVFIMQKGTIVYRGEGKGASEGLDLRAAYLG